MSFDFTAHDKVRELQKKLSQRVKPFPKKKVYVAKTPEKTSLYYDKDSN